MDTNKEAKEKKLSAQQKSNLLYDAVIIIGILMLLGGVFAVVHKYVGEEKSKKEYENLENETTQIVFSLYPVKKSIILHTS